MFNAHAGRACDVPEPVPNARIDGGPAGLQAAQDAVTPPDSDRQSTLFTWAGSHDALTRKRRIFSGRFVPVGPFLAPLFAGESADQPECVAAWIGETFGGLKSSSERYGGYPVAVAAQLRKGITGAQRSRWV